MCSTYNVNLTSYNYVNDNIILIDDPLQLQININDLPNELLILIFTMVDSETILSIEQVCQRWNRLALTAAVWENMRLVLCMKNYRKITDSIIPKVSKNLKSVKLQYFKLYSQIRVPLTTLCPKLTHLEIIISQVNHSIFEDLNCWPELQFLSFRNSLIIKETDDENRNYTFELQFNNLKKLRTLVLSNFALTPASLNSMIYCQNLVYINIEKMKNIPASFLESLITTKQKTLKELYIYGDTLNDDIVRLLSRCQLLSALHIATCKSLFDSSLTHLSALKDLESLKLRHGYFSTCALLTYFSKNVFQRLTFLSLSRCLHVTMQVARAIKANAPKLKELSFYLCPFVTEENFDRSEIRKLFSIQLLLD